jgi:hypothetical protein
MIPASPINAPAAVRPAAADGAPVTPKPHAMTCNAAAHSLPRRSSTVSQVGAASACAIFVAPASPRSRPTLMKLRLSRDEPVPMRRAVARRVCRLSHRPRDQPCNHHGSCEAATLEVDARGGACAARQRVALRRDPRVPVRQPRRGAVPAARRHDRAPGLLACDHGAHGAGVVAPCCLACLCVGVCDCDYFWGGLLCCACVAGAVAGVVHFCGCVSGCLAACRVRVRTRVRACVRVSECFRVAAVRLFYAFVCARVRKPQRARAARAAHCCVGRQCLA